MNSSRQMPSRTQTSLDWSPLPFSHVHRESLSARRSSGTTNDADLRAAAGAGRQAVRTESASAAAGCAQPDGRGETNGRAQNANGGVATSRTCVSMAALVSSLSNALQGPIDDKTSLTGLWDYELSFTGERRRNADSSAVARDPNDAPALFTAVQEQLGLKLEPGRGPVDILVIESAAQPTEN